MARARDSRTPEIAARLREARQVLFSSAAEAARALSLKEGTVRAHESGQNGVAFEDLERYARRYGVDIGWLLSGRGGQAVKPDVFQEGGVWLDIEHTLQDGVWLPDPIENWDFAVREPVTSAGGRERVLYSDPRFPHEMVGAFKIIQTGTPAPEYDGDAIVFVIASWKVGYRPGDHVIVYLEKGDFSQATLRKVVAAENGTEYHALISNEPPLTFDMLYRDDGMRGMVQGLVIGSQVRRRVNLLPMNERREPIR